MIIDNELYYRTLLANLWFFASGYFSIRYVINSIAVCGTAKKKRKSKAYYESKNFSMTYISKWLKDFKAEYEFWMNVKYYYVRIEILWMIIYAVLPCFGILSKWIYCINLLQAAVVSGIFIFQTDSNHQTKYDRIRRGGKRQRR